MIYKILHGVEIQIDEEDLKKITSTLLPNNNWTIGGNGHVVGWCLVNGKRKQLQLSRLVMDCFDHTKDVDHKFHDKTDNRKQNLRICSRSDNQCNRRKLEIAYSKYKGVSFEKCRNKWIARISYKGKSKNLGRFNSELDAALAYDRAALIVHGVYAHLNFSTIVWTGEVKLP